MNVTSALSKEECREVVKKHLQREDFELRWFVVSATSTDMKGFMGDHLKLRIYISLGDKKQQDTKNAELQFFVKSVPLDDAYRRNFAMSGGGYEKEVLFYGDLQRAVRKHLRCTEYESSTYLGTVPQCYYSRPDLLVLEDLAAAGFRLPELVEPLDVAKCECVLQALARLHATSLVFEEREGRLLADTYPLLLEDTLFRNDPAFPVYHSHLGSRRAAHLLLDLIPRFTPGTPRHEELHSLLDAALDTVYELLKPSSKYRNVLCHRDLWANNMMFATDDKGGLSVRLVDFQTLLLGPPANDVMLFLHLTTTRALRRSHGRRLLQLYHHTLADVLRQHDLSVESILPLQVFLHSCEDAKPLGVIATTYILLVTMLPLQRDANLESFVLDRTHLVKTAYQSDERFRSRMTDIIEDLVETCVLPRTRDQQR